MDVDLSTALDANFEGRTILLGVTGGIAAYKSAALASAWTQRGARVRVLMTRAATKFVTPLTFQSLTREPVAADIWPAETESSPSGSGSRPEHIDAGEAADVFLVAPATADFLARSAHGFADDIVCLTLLAHRGPVVFAPAMNDRMWGHAAVQANVGVHVQRGVQIVGPGEGYLACGSVGPGRLADLSEIDRHVGAILAR